MPVVLVGQFRCMLNNDGPTGEPVPGAAGGDDVYETIFDTISDAVFLIAVEQTDDGYTFRFQRTNTAHQRQTGLDRAEISGKTPAALFDDDQAAALRSNYRACVTRGESITYDETLDLPTGTVEWETTLTPVVDDGEVVQIVGVSRDVTAQRQRQRELRRQNERLNEFASVIAHDLRNPLNVAQGRAALLAEGSDNPNITPLLEALARMETIVEDTLTLARQGDTIADREPVPVTDLVGKCWAHVETEAATIDIAADMTVSGDFNRLRHVFENLFRNAVEHGGDDVTVTVGRLDDGTGLYVEDDGPGIPADTRDVAFEPGHTTTEDGTGFGLAIVRRIAEAHGWTVSATSSTDGGARFEFTGVEFLEE